MYQGDRADITMPITGGENGAVAANRIIIMDGAVASNGKVSTASARGFAGITLEATDQKGYAPVRTSGVAKVRVGVGGSTAGLLCASDATGQGVTITPGGAAPADKQVVGVWLETRAAGELADVRIQPMLTTV